MPVSPRAINQRRRASSASGGDAHAPFPYNQPTAAPSPKHLLLATTCSTRSGWRCRTRRASGFADGVRTDHCWGTSFCRIPSRSQYILQLETPRHLSATCGPVRRSCCLTPRAARCGDCGEPCAVTAASYCRHGFLTWCAGHGHRVSRRRIRPLSTEEDQTTSPQHRLPSVRPAPTRAAISCTGANVGASTDMAAPAARTYLLQPRL